MGLFDKFTETVFYKKESELELQIEALKNIQLKYPNNEKIKHRLRILELGLRGEKEIEFELKNANIGMYVLRDVNLKYKDLTAQIDYIILTPGYIYFVECKNLIGNIYVNERGEFIREYTYNNKKIKEGIYSPIRQAERHVEIFKKIWSERNNKVLDKIFRERKQSWFKPLVVMANSKNILDLKKAPKELKSQIIKSDLLIDYIKKDIAKIDKDLINRKQDMKENAFSIMQNYNQEISRDYEEELNKWVEKVISNSDNNSDDELRNKLLKFRTNRSKEKNIPAYYVFTNDELERIIKEKPKTIEELKSGKYLADVKINSHGKEIIKIINNKD